MTCTVIIGTVNCWPRGVNPYIYPPAAPELEAYRDGYWELIFNRDVPTGYPPLAEGLFAAAYRLSPDPWVLRALAAAASLGTTALLMAALQTAGRDERRALLYGWSPLVAMEFANSAHLDSLALLGLSAALVLVLRNRPNAAATCLALGALVKFFPALLLPIWGRRWSWRAWLVFGLAFGLPWLPLLAGGTPFKGLGTFAARVDFNSSLYRPLETLWFLILNSPGARPAALGTVTLVIVAIYLAYLLRRPTGGIALDDWRFIGSLFSIGLALSPVVHP